MTIEGHWFEADNSTRQVACLNVSGNTFSLSVAGQILRDGQLSELSFSDRMGNTPRYITWSDGAMFETSENDVVDSWLDQSNHTASRSIFLHRLESNWTWVAVALLVTVVASFVGIRYGLPAVSERMARSLPPSVSKTVSTQALAALDKLMFQPTETSTDRQMEVQAQFDELLAQLPETDFIFNLHFRRMHGVANAMALPGGDVVVTDTFLELVEHPEELDSVLLHEIGHVVEHHGMTQAIRASALSVIVSLSFGDLNALGDVAVGVPVFIMQNSYSQAAETEADDYAFERMREMGKDPKHFAAIILRLSEEALDESDVEDDSGYFSSHPGSQARARKALEASKAL